MDNQQRTENLWTRETWGMTLCLFGGLGLLVMLFGTYILGVIGASIVGFMLGTVGYFSYLLFASLIWIGVCMVRDKKTAVPTRYIVTLSLVLFFAGSIAHVAMSASYNLNTYSVYLASCFQNGLAGYASAPFGGLLLGSISYPLIKYTTSIGAIAIFSFFTVIFAGLFVYFLTGHSFSVLDRVKKEKSVQKPIEQTKLPVDPQPQEEVKEESVSTMQESAEEPVVSPVDVPYASVMPQYPRPHVRSVHEKPVEMAQPHAAAYLRSLERFDQIVQQYMEQQQQNEVGDPYTAPIDRPDSDYQRRNDAFYTNAEKILKQPVRSADPKGFSDVRTKVSQMARESSRSILFPEGDQAINYQNNLIFDSGSQFNARQTDMRGGYKPVNFNPVSEPMGDGPRKIVTDTTQVQESPYIFQDTQTGRSPFSRSVEEIPFKGRTDDRTPSMESAVRPVQTPEQPREGTVTTRPVEPRVDRTPERFGTDRPVEPRVDRTPERFGTDRPVAPRVETPIGKTDDAESVGMGSTATERPVEQPQQPTNNLSFSSVFSSGTNNTGRTQFDMSKVNRDKFADRFQKARERSESKANLFDDDKAEINPLDSSIETRNEARMVKEPVVRTPIVQTQETVKISSRAYKAPPYDFFNHYQDTLSANQAEIEENSQIIVDTLGDFRIEAEVMKVTSGPTVTRYDIEIPRGIQARKVAMYDEDIARRLHVQGGVTIYPNFESGYISIEVPNKERATVGLAPVLMDPAFRKAKPTSLMFGMGKDVEGRSICGDIVKMTHMLVAGSTGSGKSVFLNELIVSLMMKYSPEELRMILIDPKQVEFVVYQNLPHLMINEIVNDPTRVINILNWAIEEMNRRYTLFQQKTQSGRLVRNIDEYNDTLADEPKLPKIVIIIDELADLMLRAKKEIEDRIQNLTQKSRAAGIHMIIATQRPSVDVITGIIKSNLPTRVAFRVAQEVDSRTILDDSGAEKLLGKGDMLYKTAEMPSPYRLQCAFLSSEEVQHIVEYVKENNVATFDTSITEYLNATEASSSGSEGGDATDGELDPVYIEALRYVVMIGQASISMIQRRCGVGYNRAGKIIEWMESMGYISPFEGAKARTVLLTKEEFEAKYGNGEE